MYHATMLHASSITVGNPTTNPSPKNTTDRMRDATNPLNRCDRDKGTALSVCVVSPLEPAFLKKEGKRDDDSGAAGGGASFLPKIPENVPSIPSKADFG